MRRSVAAALAALAPATIVLAGCDRAPAEPRVEVERAWVRLPAAPDRPGALYFTLASNNDPTRLVGISSPAAERIDLHGTRIDNGIARMAPLEPAETTFEDGRLVYAPGGRHAMVHGLPTTLRAGQSIPVTFTFDPAPPVTVDAELRGPGDHAH